MLNGVYMTPSFDGHLQNMNFLFTGNPFGGDSFIPHLNLPETGREPQSLDAILPTDPVVVNVNNHSGVVPLRPDSVGGLRPSAQADRAAAAGRRAGRRSFAAGMTANATGPGPLVRRRQPHAGRASIRRRACIASWRSSAAPIAS